MKWKPENSLDRMISLKNNDPEVYEFVVGLPYFVGILGGLVIALLILLFPFQAFASFDVNLKYGDKGSNVSELQEFLVDQGYLNYQITGNFYALTLKAVKAFQLANNLPSTGYFGILSRGVANSILDIESIPPPESETGTTTQNNVPDGTRQNNNPQHIPESTPTVSPKTVVLWDSFFTVEDKNEGAKINVEGYTSVSLKFNWEGTGSHACQYAYAFADKDGKVLYYSTFLYFENEQCYGSIDIPVALNATTIKIDSWTSRGGVLNGSILLK